MSIADLWKSREPADLRRAMKDVDDTIAAIPPTAFGKKQPIGPREVNAIAASIDLVETQLARNSDEREDLVRQLDAFRAELADRCNYVIADAQNMKQHYLGPEKEPEPTTTGEPHEGDQGKPSQSDPSPF